MDWTETQPIGNNNANWSCLSASESGEVLLGIIEAIGVYYSNDGAQTWSPKAAYLGAKKWYACAVSGDGEYLVIACRFEMYEQGKIFRSNNEGSTWTDITPSGAADKKWASLAIDKTGQHMIACALGDFVYISNDYGVSWSIAPVNPVT